jgi:DNA-binding MarR family transcriptional regulator
MDLFIPLQIMTKLLAPGAEDELDSIQTVMHLWTRERPDADLSGLAVALWITRLAKFLDMDFSATFREEFGLQIGDMRLLFALRRSGRPYAMRPTDLFRALLVTSGAVTKQVDRLCEMGFVVRWPDPDHAGGSLIGLTKNGKQIADAAIDSLVGSATISNAIATTLQSYQPEEQQFIEQFLHRLLVTVEAAAEGRKPRK